MIREGQTAGTVCGIGDPVAQALARINTAQHLPAVSDLVSGILEGISGLDGVREAAVLVMPDPASTLDPAWCQRPQNCLARWIGPGKPKWVTADPSWRRRLLAAAAGAAVVNRGRGPLGGDLPWPAEPWGPADRWQALTLDLKGDVLLAILLVMPENRPAEEEAAAGTELARLKLIMQPVLEIWAEAAALRARLKHAATENRALSRINQLQGRFVAMASHEFKTPLTSISAYADVLKGQITDEVFPHANEFLDVIRTEAARLLRMINRILDFSRLEFGSNLLELQLLDLEPLVRETIRSLKPAMQDKHLEAEVNAPHRLPKVEIDADLIRQVLVNLVGNAVKYTPERGRITVRLAEEESTVSVKVIDDGPGIAPEDMRRIFREFYRARGVVDSQDGTGLGLSIARHIVHLHGGHISVAPGAGGGSEFTFLLPKAAEVWGRLPSYLTKDGDSADTGRLLMNLMRLLAELTGSLTTALLLRDGTGSLAPICGLGLDPGNPSPAPFPETPRWSRFLEQGAPLTDEQGATDMITDLEWLWPGGRRGGRWLLAPVARQGKVLGCVILGNRRGGTAFDEGDQAQVRILTGLVHTALARLDLQVGKTIEAVKALIQIRRSGVPTATPAALRLVRMLAERLGSGAEEILQMQWAAALHDAGMVRIEDEIVLGQSGLSWDEKDEIDSHVEQGLELMRPLIPGEAVAAIIRHHHERMDGSGYPDGLQGGDIPLGSRVLAIVDAWFSLTMGRPYRKGLGPEAALAEIIENGGSQFDPVVVAEFQEIVTGLAPLVSTGPGPAAGGPESKE